MSNQLTVRYDDYLVKNKPYTRKLQHNIERKIAREQRRIDRYFAGHYMMKPPEGFIADVLELNQRLLQLMIEACRISI